MDTNLSAVADRLMASILVSRTNAQEYLLWALEAEQTGDMTQADMWLDLAAFWEMSAYSESEHVTPIRSRISA